MALCGELLKQCSVCTRSVSMPLLLGFGWMHSQQLRSAWRRAGLCLGCTELRTDHRGLAPKQGWHRDKLTFAGSFCLPSLHMEQGRMGISACAREHRQLRWELPRVQKSLPAFKLWFLSSRKQPWHGPLLALMAAVFAQWCQWFKRRDCTSRGPMGRSSACLSRAGRWALTRSDSSGDS